VFHRSRVALFKLQMSNILKAQSQTLDPCRLQSQLIFNKPQMFSKNKFYENSIVTVKYDGILTFFTVGETCYTASLVDPVFRIFHGLSNLKSVTYRGAPLILVCEFISIEDIVVFDCDLKQCTYSQRLEILAKQPLEKPFRLTKSYALRDVESLLKNEREMQHSDGLIFTPIDVVISSNAAFREFPTLKWKSIVTVDFLILPHGTGKRVVRTVWCCKKMSYEDFLSEAEVFKVKFRNLKRHNEYWPCRFDNNVLNTDSNEYDHMIVECVRHDECSWDPIAVRWDKSLCFDSCLKSRSSDQQLGLSCINEYSCAASVQDELPSFCESNV